MKAMFLLPNIFQFGSLIRTNNPVNQWINWRSVLHPKITDYEIKNTLIQLGRDPIDKNELQALIKKYKNGSLHRYLDQE